MKNSKTNEHEGSDLGPRAEVVLEESGSLAFSVRPELPFVPLGIRAAKDGIQVFGARRKVTLPLDETLEDKFFNQHGVRRSARDLLDTAPDVVLHEFSAGDLEPVRSNYLEVEELSL